METHSRIRQHIAQACARIIVEEGISQYALAKKKAIHRLGLEGNQDLPSNEEIDLALQEYHRIFRFMKQPQFIRKLQEIALETMELFEDFSPRLVGPVLEGTAGDHSPILLHLFPETPEEVLLKINQVGIPFREMPFADVELNTRLLKIPVIELSREERIVRIFLYPAVALRQSSKNAPPRASLKKLRKLLASHNADGS